MPPTKRKLDSHAPFIAGAENPKLNTNASFPSTTNDPFSDYMEYSTGSPDTLQHLDASRHKESPSFTNTQQLDLLEGGYNEMSDDSAGSSKRSTKRNESMSSQMSPEDSSMTNNGTEHPNEHFDMSSMIDFSHCLDDEPSITTGNEHPWGKHVNMGMFGATSSGFVFGNQQTGGMGKMDPTDNFNGSFMMNSQSPCMPTITAAGMSAPQHNRHYSVSFGPMKRGESH